MGFRHQIGNTTIDIQLAAILLKEKERLAGNAPQQALHQVSENTFSEECAESH